jgi:exosortase
MKVPDRSSLWAALACAAAGAAVFQFFGNGNRGYIDTASLFYWWGFQWFNEGSETEHGPLVLGLAAWLFWRSLRNADRELRIADWKRSGGGNDGPATIDRAALGTMGGALLLHALGFAAQQARISILALLLFAWGVLRLAGGPRWGRAAAFPLAFLVFAIPVSALDSVGFWLRVWVVDASAAIARAAGVAVLQSGTQLVAPDGAYNYDVAAACSGIRSLTALAALSLLAGYLNFRTAWRRGVGLLLCLPLVYIGNVARILAIIFAAEAGGPAWGDRAHDLMGYGIFAIVLGGVLAANAIVQRFAPEPAVAATTDGGGGAEKDGPATALWRTAAAVAGLAALTLAGLYALTQAPPRGKAGVVLAADGANPAELPAFLGTEWIGRRAEISAVERELLPPDTGFSRKTYVAVADPRQQVFLSLVLSGRDRTSIHRPELCLVGQGWTVRDTGRMALRRPGPGGGEMPATRLRVDREVATAKGPTRVPQLVVYWFVGGDRMVASHGGRMALDAWQRVTRARADRWAYVLMQTDATDGEAAAMARLQAVIDGALPGVLLPAK